MVSLQLGNPRRDPSLKALPLTPGPSSYASAQEIPETTPKTFKRFRSSLEQSLKTTTGSRAKDLPSVDDSATASVKGKGMKELEDHVAVKGQNKDKIMSRLRRAARVSTSTPIPLDASHTNAIGATTGNNADVVTKSHQAGFTSFATPSLLQTSVSSSVLHLPSQNLPSGPSQPATMAPLTNTGTIIPARDRMRRAGVQPIKSKEISGPQPLASRHDHRSGAATPDRSGAASPRASKSRQSPVLSTPRGRSSINTPRRSHDSSRRLGYLATHTSLRSSPPSPIPNRATSPVRAGTPLKQVASTSASASHLPLNSSTRMPSVDAPRRPSVDAPQRGSIDTPQRPFDTSRRPSTETSRRGTIDMHRRPTASPVPRACSPPSVRTPAHTQNRFNISTASLISPSTPEQQLRKAPAHLARSDAQKELERVWGKSGGASASSTNSQVALGGVNSVVLSSAGEERERKLFCEALRDGVVLCQLMNKRCSGTITRIDHREDGFKHTNNIARFIAACSQHGVPSGDIFYRDDLVQATPETLCRVACTIISLIKLFENPGVGRAKIITGQGKKAAITTSSNDPCSLVISGAASPASNLLPQPVSATFPSGPTCRMQGPHEQSLLPTRPDSPQSGTSASTAKRVPIIDRSTAPASNNDHEIDEVPPITGPSPAPRSHFRAQSRTGFPDDISTSQLSSPSTAGYDADYPPRQSRTSSNLTDNTALSSIFDIRRASSSNQNKFGTIRTFTTEATSCSEAPSSTRTEASLVAASMTEEMSRRRGGESTSRLRERRPSEPGVLDLVSLAEEEENSACGSSSNNHQRESLQSREPSQEETEAQVRVRLGKGKWPDDFLDAFKAQAPAPSRAVPIATSSNRIDTPLNSSPPSVSPTRKLSIVSSSHHNDSTEPTVRRPSHRSTHSTDVLMPKNSVLRLDANSENSPGSKVILRRQSTRNGARRNGVSYPRNNTDDPDTAKDDDPHIVPFPRVVSGEYAARATPSPDSTARGGVTTNQDAPRVRGRFQSDEDHRARRCSRPASRDELGRPRRSRYESMVSLGVASANASATDLLSRDSSDGGAIRQTVIVKEEGKPAIHFQLGNCIGRGQFGTVYRALNLTTGQMVAVKRIRLEGLKEDEVAQLMREVDLMKRLSHPSIVKYEGMDRDEQYLNIVLEYAESGSLGQMLRAFGKLNEHLVASYVVKILEGLHYLHCCDVVHCDLKAANILTTKTGNIKLSDFGVSLNLKAIEREKEVAGTPNWMAPEVIELKGASTKADIWSLGCTVVELLTGRPPFWDITNTMTGMIDEMPIPEECSEPLKDFLQQCFQKEPLMRPNAELLCEHPWLKKNWDALKDLRPQDSIPFLRRISTDFQKTEVAYLASMDINRVESPFSESVASVQEEPSKSPRRRLSSELSSPISLPDDTPFTPRDHSFIKTTFGKREPEICGMSTSLIMFIAMVCRVCMGSVKRGAVICDKCNLITHSKCAPEAPLTCDLRSQLLQYAEQGSPAGIPLDRSNGLYLPRPSTTVPSEVSFATPSPRPSLDITPSSPLPSPSPTPPKSVNHLKCSRSSLATENRPPPSASALQTPQPPSHDDVGPKRNLSKLPSNMISKERPHSLSSNSTAPNAGSIKTADSQSSRQESGRKSILSIVEPDTDTIPLLGPPVPEKRPFYTHPMAATANDHMDITSRHILGTMSNEPHRYRRRGAEKPSGCTIQ
ncbi:Pkinase-domain-containing protein [Suillus decipiens]|nr:Pkinase-domain-containing protein [Suillus decipiens]